MKQPNHNYIKSKIGNKTICFLLALLLALSLPGFTWQAQAAETTRTVTFTLPENAEMTLYGREKATYGYTFTKTPTQIDSGASGAIYNYELDDKPYYYLVHKEGCVPKIAAIAARDKTTEYSVGELAPLPGKRIDYATAYTGRYFAPFEDGILTNAPESQQIRLSKVGDSFVLKTFRATQLVSNAVSSLYYEPDYHYQLVAGDSVTLDDSQYLNRCKITAVKDGVSVIRVTYDPLQVADFGEKIIFNGIDPVHVGLLVVTVGGGEPFETGIELGEFDSVYINDGVYMLGKTLLEGTAQNTADYNFTLPEEIAEAEVKVLYPPANPLEATDWGFALESNWVSCTRSDNRVTVPLKEGRNIIRVKSDDRTEYHVARALKTKIYIENETFPGSKPAVGEATRVRFSNLNLPLPKLTKIYNPGFNLGSIFKDKKETVRIEYNMNGEKVQSEGTQHNLHTESYFYIYPEDNGTLSFSEGQIVLTNVGYAPAGEHRTLPEEGFDDALRGMAGEYYHEYSYLPDFSFEVQLSEHDVEGEEPSEEPDTEFLDYAKANTFDLHIPKLSSGAQLAQLLKIYTTNDQKQNWFFTSPQKTAYPLSPKVIGLNIENGEFKDYDIYWRYWKAGEEEQAVIEKLSSVPTEDNPLKSGNLSLSTCGTRQQKYADADKGIIFSELIFVPCDNSKVAATFSVMTAAVGQPQAYPFLGDITIEPVDKGNMYTLTDGLLKPAPAALEEENIDLGYGFLLSGRDYTVTVPYGTEAIKLKLQHFAIKSNNANALKFDVESNNELEKTIWPQNYDPETDTTIKGKDRNFAPIEISLKEEGDTVITLVSNQLPLYKNMGYDFFSNEDFFKANNGIKYTITVKHGVAPCNVSFDVPESAKFVLKDNISKTVAPNEAGGKDFTLNAGTYKASFTGTNFAPKTVDLVIAENDGIYTVTFDNKPVELDGDKYSITTEGLFSAVEDHAGGKVAVRILGVDSIVHETTVIIPATEDIPDLTAYVNAFNPKGKLRYVRSNYGGYTALHSVIDALLEADQHFVCVNGKLSPSLVFSKAGHGENKGWDCRVDGMLVEPAETRLVGGETVTFYYNAALADQQYSWFTESTAKVARNKSVSLALVGSPASKDATTENSAPINDATIFLDGEQWTHVSWEEGKYTLTNFHDVPLGQHTITAHIDNGAGVNRLTYTEMQLTVEASEGNVAPRPEGMTKEEALDSVYVAFDRLVNRAYGKESFEAIRKARDNGVSAINNASSDFETLAETAISAINAAAQRYDVAKALRALVVSPDGYVSVKMEDFGVRIPGPGIDYPEPLGVLVPSTRVPFESGDTIGDVTLRLLKALGIEAQHSYSQQYGSMYLEKIGQFYLPTGEYVKEFGEFSSGPGSGWMITLNDWFINLGVSYFEVENGDVIRWQNTCQVGSDIGGNNQTANLVDIVFKDKLGTLSPRFNNATEHYIYTIPKSVTSVQLEARPESGMTQTFYKVSGRTYERYEPIPVENGTLIEVVCQYKGTGSTVLKEKSWTVTIQVQGEAPVTPGQIVKDVVTTINPKVTAKDGNAQASVGASDMSKAVEEAKKDKSSAIVVAPDIKGAADEVSVELPKSSISDMASKTDADLKVETPVGDVTIPSNALASVVGSATGSDIVITVEKKAAEDVADKSVDTSSNIVVSVTITSGGKDITSFGGKSITIDLPVDGKFAEGRAYSVVQISAGGSKQMLTGKCIKVGGKLVVRVSTTHLSTFVVLSDKQIAFTDINGHWAEEGIKYVCSRGIMNGTSDTAFSPESTLSRAMLVTMLYRLEGEPKIGKVNSFTDVEAGTWYTDAISWASENDIVSGMGDGKFAPNADITREQMAAILHRYAKYKKYDISKTANLSGFADLGDISAWALDPMKWANGMELINGRTKTTIVPKGTAKRAEAAVILMRFMENVAK